ncbi:MAG: redox-sensing transcriptional repressor Rex [Chloroflexi bacterium]|nr:redox-sensing transcriptional repressor Rex [Chloroflexota bacterium]
MSQRHPDRHAIPPVVVNRLPLYLRTLCYAQQEGLLTISSKELGRRLGFSAAQIRKDLSLFGEFGKQGTGYPIPQLIQALRRILHIDHMWDMALVGVGALGRALLRYQGLTKRGFRIAMAFDSDPRKIGQRIGPFVVQDVARLEEAIRMSGIRLGVIATPPDAAQTIAERMVAAGVRGILSYAPIYLQLPPEVRVEYIDPVVHLQRITFYIGPHEGSSAPLDESECQPRREQGQAQECEPESEDAP